MDEQTESLFLPSLIKHTYFLTWLQVKMLALNKTEKENALNEIRLIASIKHPNVIEYKESFIDEGS